MSRKAGSFGAFAHGLTGLSKKAMKVKAKKKTKLKPVFLKRRLALAKAFAKAKAFGLSKTRHSIYSRR